MSQQVIPGYNYGSSVVPHSPLSLEDFEHLKETVLFSNEDSQYLRMSYDVLEDQIEEILDVWYGFVASHPFLVHFFSDRGTGQPMDTILRLCANGLDSGFLIQPGLTTTKPGSITSTRSGCAIIVVARIARMG